MFWQWEWINDSQLDEGDGDDASHTSIIVIPETSDEEEEDEEDSQADLNISPLQVVITHSIVFKCIGYTKENRYQETLCHAAQCMAKDEDIPCIVEPELSNPVDEKAIAFKWMDHGKLLVMLLGKYWMTYMLH